jgi:hypothetical protein
MPGNLEDVGGLTGKSCGVMIVTSTVWLGDSMAELIAADGCIGPALVVPDRAHALSTARRNGTELAVIAALSAPP